MAALLSLHFYVEDDSWEQGSQYLKPVVAVKLDLDSSESPTQNGRTTSSAGYSLGSKGKAPQWCTAYATSSPTSLCPLQRSFYRGSESFLGHECSRTTVSQMHFTAVAKSLVLKHHAVYFQKSLADPFLSHVLALQNLISTKNITRAKLVWSGIFRWIPVSGYPRYLTNFSTLITQTILLVGKSIQLPCTGAWWCPAVRKGQEDSSQ